MKTCDLCKGKMGDYPTTIIQEWLSPDVEGTKMQICDICFEWIKKVCK